MCRISRAMLLLVSLSLTPSFFPFLCILFDLFQQRCWLKQISFCSKEWIGYFRFNVTNGNGLIYLFLVRYQRFTFNVYLLISLLPNHKINIKHLLKLFQTHSHKFCDTSTEIVQIDQEKWWLTFRFYYFRKLTSSAKQIDANSMSHTQLRRVFERNSRLAQISIPILAEHIRRFVWSSIA